MPLEGGSEDKMEPMAIERRNLLDVCKLVVKELLGNTTNYLVLVTKWPANYGVP